jgi:hypothetical protein
MRKLFTLGVVAAMALTASAADYQVYSNGVLSDGLAQNHWWNCEGHYGLDGVNPTNADGKVMYITQNLTSGNASFGISCGDNKVVGKLHSAKLHFDWYAVGTGKFNLKLNATNLQCEKDFVTLDESNTGKWNSSTVDIATSYPEVAAQWEAGKVGDIFSVVLAGVSDDCTIYVDNVYYSDLDESWTPGEEVVKAAPTTVPTPDKDAENVKSLFGSSYEQATNFAIQNWGQTTKSEIITIDGKQVYHFSYFTFEGFNFNTLDASDMDYLHVDMWTPDAESYLFTPIGEGEKLWTADKVALEEWNSYDVPLTYYDNVNFANLTQFKMDQVGQKGENDYYVTNIYFWKDTNKVDNGDNGEDNGEDNGDNNNGDDNNSSTTAGAVFTGEVNGVQSQTIVATQITTDYPYTFNYTITYNEDKTLTIEGSAVWQNGQPVGMIDTNYLWIEGGNPYQTESEAQGSLKVTTTETFEAGRELNMTNMTPMADGQVKIPFTYTVGASNSESGVATVAVEANAPVVYYNLQGARVANPENGIFIRVQGNRATKVAL